MIEGIERARRGLDRNRPLTRKLWFEVLIVVVLPAGVVAAMNLTPFVSRPSTMPFGVDTSTYIWRTNVVHHLDRRPSLRR